MKKSVYNFVLALGLFILLPKTLWLYFFRGKYRESLFLRFKSRAPKTNNRSVIWLHGSSLGEIKALSTLVPLIRESYPTAFILISTITETGQTEAKKSIKEADAVCYLPHDFSWVMRPFIQTLRPKLLILVEGDFWPNLLKEAKRSKAFIVVASAKLSKKSLNRYLFFKSFTQMCFSPIDYFFTQGEVYKNRFIQLGIDPKKVKITGNLKFDIFNPPPSKSELLTLKKKMGLKKDDFIVTCGSTHPREERALLKELNPLLKKYSHFKVLIVPRHPERFNAVKKLLLKRVKSFGTFSSPNKKEVSVHLIDKIGILPICYQISTLALVGGSFVKKVGGHNIFEPAKLGVPVLFGPYVHKQTDLSQLLTRSGAGKQVKLGELSKYIEKAIQSPVLLDQMGVHGKELAGNVLGSAEKTWKELCFLLGKCPHKKKIL